MHYLFFSLSFPSIPKMIGTWPNTICGSFNFYLFLARFNFCLSVVDFVVICCLLMKLLFLNLLTFVFYLSQFFAFYLVRLLILPCGSFLYLSVQKDPKDRSSAHDLLV